MELRQHLARFLTADGSEFGNWNSKAQLRDGALGLDKGVRQVPIARRSPDLPRIFAEYPRAATFAVIGLDAFQVPVFKREYRCTTRAAE